MAWETCGSQHPLVDGDNPAQGSWSALWGLESPRYCRTSSHSPLGILASALVTQMSLWPLKGLGFHSLCSYQENLLVPARVQLDTAGPGSHSAALCGGAQGEPRGKSERSPPAKTETTNTGGAAQRYSGEKNFNLLKPGTGSASGKHFLEVDTEHLNPVLKEHHFPSLRPGCILSF